MLGRLRELKYIFAVISGPPAVHAHSQQINRERECVVERERERERENLKNPIPDRTLEKEPGSGSYLILT